MRQLVAEELQYHGDSPPAKIGPLTLSPNQVHVWSANLDESRGAIDRWRDTMSHDELLRSNRFHFEMDRCRFIAARGLLRELLGGYLQSSAREVAFDYRPQGKPVLRHTWGESIHFNVSHSQGHALFAFSRGRELGIDLERIRSDIDCEQLSERCFSPVERQLLNAVSSHLRRRAFFACWTRKEAYVKATGLGLTLPLEEFDVSVDPGMPALLSSRQFPVDVNRCTMQELTPAPDFVGCLAVLGH